MRTLYQPALNGRIASDWLRPVPYQREGDKLPKGPYQSSNGYSARVHLPGHLACNPSSRREASHISSQGKEAVFVTHDTYMGNVFHINGSTISITPLQSRIEAIQKLQPPTNVKGCKSFCGVVNYLSIFCRHLQKLLKPIYDLTKKGRPFIWQEEQQQAFDTIKERITNPPILYLPKPEERFILYCDSSRTHTGSSLWQVQEGKPRLIGYASKSLPAPAINYIAIELEMTEMAVNIHLWRHLLHRVEFDCAIDHRT